MKTWFRRVISLMLIALGIALIAFRYNNQQSGYKEKEVVYLQIENYLHPDKIKKDYPLSEPVELIGPEMNQEDFPCIWWAIADLDESWTTDTCDIAEWEKLKTAFSEKAQITELIVFHDAIIRAKTQNEKVVFTYLGEFNPYIKDISTDDLAKFPEIQEAVKEPDSTGESAKMISEKEWRRFVQRHLDTYNDGQRFRTNGKVYGPEFGSDITEISGEVKNLSAGLRIIGVILLLLGLALVRTIYFRKKGIMVNPKKIAFLYDFITLLFAVPSAYVLTTAALQKYFFIEPVFYEQEMTFMGIFFFIFGIPFMAIFTSRLTSQSVAFSKRGILVDSLNRKDFITWENIQSVAFSNEYVLVGRVGTVIPKKLQKSLKIEGEGETVLLINEPQLKSVKRKIVRGFQNTSPVDVWEKHSDVLNSW